MTNGSLVMLQTLTYNLSHFQGRAGRRIRAFNVVARQCCRIAVINAANKQRLCHFVVMDFLLDSS